MTVLVMGSLHRDVVVDAPRLPRLGETLQGDAVDYRFGGKGGNQAVAAARMGAAVAMAGRVGRDPAGAEVLAVLDAEGVDRSRVAVTEAATGMSVAITETAGEYGAVIVSAANLANDGRDAVPGDVRVCVLQNEVPEAANLALAARLPGDVTLILNAAPGRRVPGALMARVDVLVVNAVEARDLTGADRPEAAARALCEAGAGAAIVTLGAEGVCLCEGGEVHRAPAPEVTVVSAHGAGDMFIGALAAALWNGTSLGAATEAAQGAAARFVSLPVARRGEVSAL